MGIGCCPNLQLWLSWGLPYFPHPLPLNSNRNLGPPELKARAPSCAKPGTDAENQEMNKPVLLWRIVQTRGQTDRQTNDRHSEESYWEKASPGPRWHVLSNCARQTENFQPLKMCHSAVYWKGIRTAGPEKCGCAGSKQEDGEGIWAQTPTETFLSIWWRFHQYVSEKGLEARTRIMIYRISTIFCAHGYSCLCQPHPEASLRGNHNIFFQVEHPGYPWLRKPAPFCSKQLVCDTGLLGS